MKLVETAVTGSAVRIRFAVLGGAGKNPRLPSAALMFFKAANPGSAEPGLPRLDAALPLELDM
jgi:hypothetical protein